MRKEQKAMTKPQGGEKGKAGKAKKKAAPKKRAPREARKAKQEPEIIEGEIIAVKRTIPPNAGKKPGDLSHKTRKAIALVVDHGVTPKEAMILTGCTKTVNPQTVSAFKGKVEKYSLQRPIMQKLANQAVKDTLEMKPLKDENNQIISYPSHTNRLAAVAMIVDRVDPAIKRSESLNVTVDCSPIDLEKYRNR